MIHNDISRKKSLHISKGGKYRPAFLFLVNYDGSLHMPLIRGKVNPVLNLTSLKEKLCIFGGENRWILHCSYNVRRAPVSAAVILYSILEEMSEMAGCDYC